MVLGCHSSARFPYRLLFILGFSLFLPTSQVRLLVLFYFSFMPLSVFTYFRKAYFLLHFLSPFLVLRLPASFSVFSSINFFIVCVFSVFLSVHVLSFDSYCLCLSSFPPVYSVSLCWVTCLSAQVAVFQHLFQGNGANHRTFDFGPRSKLLQYVVSSRRHLKPGASRSRQPNIYGFVLRDEWDEITVTLPLLINTPSHRMLLGLSLSVIWFPSANLFRSNSQFLNTHTILATETSEEIV